MKITIALLVFSLSVITALAQQPTKPPQTDKTQKPTTGKPAEENQDVQGPQIVTYNVRLPIAVIDKGNRFVTDLKQSDFEVYENKVKQEDIVSFIAETNLPLDIALLMDTSNSVKPKLKFQRDAAVSFLQTVLRPRVDRALFLSFNSDIELHQDYTNRIDLLSGAIDKVKAYGETRLYDAVYRVCEEKMFAEAGRRRAIVLITDGEDTASEHSLEDAINIALRAEAVVFVISNKAAGFFGVQAGQVDSQEDKSLKKLAEDTGGRAFFTGTTLELERGFANVTKELRSQYLLAYAPSNTVLDGKMREIEVKVPGRKDLKIRARKGYPAIRPGMLTSDVKPN
ncbi:MAG TPA: VWA domain-containing protein [Blastocatellia bacterium]|nr:VWA domain-containing protein [Blastocatellia bacterium]